MAWTAPPVYTVGQVLTAALMNNISGDLTDLDGRTRIQSGSVATSQTTTSTSYADLATVGPSVTVTTGTLALVVISTGINTSGAGNTPHVGVNISGATTLAASDPASLQNDAGAAVLLQVSWAMMMAVTAGSNTFKLVYRVGAATGTFYNRSIIVWPANNLT